MTQFDELGNEVLTPEQQEQENRERFDYWWRIAELTRDEAVQILAGVEPPLPWHDGMRSRYLPHAFDGKNATRKAMDKRTRDDSFDADIEMAVWQFKDARFDEPRSLNEWLACAAKRGVYVPWRQWMESHKENVAQWWHKHVTLDAALKIAQKMEPIARGKGSGLMSVSAIAKRLAEQINRHESVNGTNRTIVGKTVDDRFKKLGISDQIRRCKEA